MCKGRPWTKTGSVRAAGHRQLNGNLLGGGQLQSGDYIFDFWLNCDFQLENSSRTLESAGSGLSTALKWTYTGGGQDGPIVIYSGIEPYLSENSFSQSARTGASGPDLHGIELPGDVLPDWNAQDARLRWAVKAELPDGTLAAQRGVHADARGRRFTPVNIALLPLTEAELAGPNASEVIDRPFALLDADAEYRSCRRRALLAKREAELLAAAADPPAVQYSTDQSVSRSNLQRRAGRRWMRRAGSAGGHADPAERKIGGTDRGERRPIDLTPWTYRINLGLTRYRPTWDCGIN